MSEFLIAVYQKEVEKIIQYGGTSKETAIRTAFVTLLNSYAHRKGLMLITEITVKGSTGKNVTPDGTLKDSLRQDWGYWESKDESDIIDDEIKKKFARGYPKDNILFEDSQTAVLFQNGNEVLRASFNDAAALDNLLNQFINFERPEVTSFRKAIELFKQDIPKVTDTIRDLLEVQEKSNPKFVKERNKFHKLCHDSINPDVSKDDVHEMIIQHILTEDIFNTIFDETQFHRENNVARQLEGVINTFFTGATKKTALSTLQHYSKAINAAAAGIADHHEKQKFLKAVYETFYKSYNPKAADRLGVVYTPGEIVQFMIESADYVLHKHFNKYLEDKGVEILDPATGTGTFICDLIDYLRKDKLEYKYKNELHANEVAILPYYISNLNIEFTYTQKMGRYEEFENLCFVDTLDNMGFAFRGKQINLFEPFTEENSKRIYNQNTRKISVIIGNPPYNANQISENDDNKNREYSLIDKRIKDTFIKYSSAQKTKVYDMYSRFYRWAMDRLQGRGIICFITNNSFINSRTFDGFRKCIQDEFQYAYIIDLGGNIRELSGRDGIFLNEKHTIFGQAAAVGIAMMFLIKDTDEKTTKSKSATKCVINYIHPTDIRATREEKLAFLANHKFKDIPFEHIVPDKNNNWINLADNDFDDLIPLCSKEVKSGKNSKAIFELFSLGVSTNRDEWVVDFSADALESKMKYFTKFYNNLPGEYHKWEDKIKWSRNLKRRFEQGKRENYKREKITKTYYRPFVIKSLYNSDLFIDEKGACGEVFSGENKVILFRHGDRIDFCVNATDQIPNLNIYSLDPAQYVPLYRYSGGKRTDNITDWALGQFRKRYGNKVSKEDIFHYVYAVMNSPKYKLKYELNLKREYPRIPFYENFKKWCGWGEQLLDLQLNFETVNAFKLAIKNSDSIKTPKPKLKVDKESGSIIIDESTVISGVPDEVWSYRLGNRSALEWVLDQYKVKKAGDKTIAEKFDNYDFADYKTQVIDLLKRVCTVSVETMKIIKEMEAENE